MKATGVALAALSLVAHSGCATRSVFPAPAGARSDVRLTGYLDPDTVSHLSARTPAPPPPGSVAETEDRAASERLRTMEDGDRWLLASLHADLNPARVGQLFDCRLGTRLAEQATPALDRLLARALVDARLVSDRARGVGFRFRPVALDGARRACVRLTPAVREGTGYPSAAAVAGVVVGGSLASLVPDRAGALIGMGREIGLSRAICGLESPADVAAGQTLGAAVLAEVQRTQAFRQDAVDAGHEVAMARAGGLTSPACAAERAAFSAVKR